MGPQAAPYPRLLWSLTRRRLSPSARLPFEAEIVSLERTTTLGRCARGGRREQDAHPIVPMVTPASFPATGSSGARNRARAVMVSGLPARLFALRRIGIACVFLGAAPAGCIPNVVPSSG